jgi:hypothetical protein
MDQETDNVQTTGQMLSDYIKSDGWHWVRDRLMEKIMDLQSIMNVETASVDLAFQDMKARRIAVETLLELIRDVEGTAQQHSNNAGNPPTPEDPILVNNE